MAHQEPTRRHSGGSEPARDIPDKLYFRIGEVAALCDVPTYVLRFWETEFPQLKPNKGGTGQRLYRRRDVEMALRIKSLLYDEGYTIAGARQAFKSELRTTRDAQLGLDGIARPIHPGDLEALRKQLQDLHTQLSRPIARFAMQPVQPIRAPRPTAPHAKPVEPPAPFPKAKLLDPAKFPILFDSLFEALPPED